MHDGFVKVVQHLLFCFRAWLVDAASPSLVVIGTKLQIELLSTRTLVFLEGALSLSWYPMDITRTHRIWRGSGYSIIQRPCWRGMKKRRVSGA